jgi:hypothetical protein
VIIVTQSVERRASSVDTTPGSFPEITSGAGAKKKTAARQDAGPL